MRLSVLLGLCMLGVAFLVGTSDGGGEKKDKNKGFLPQNWKDLNLTAAQKDKAYEVLGAYKKKLEGLKEQEKALKQEEKGELAKILTPEQKEQLQKIVVGEGGKKSGEKAPEKTEKK